MRQTMLRFARIELGDGTTGRCARCHDPRPAAPRNATEIAREIERASSGWGSGPGPNISLAGFEPLEHPSLYDLIAVARAAGAERIRLESDFAALSQAGTCERVLRQGVTHFRFTLLGPGSSKNDSLLARTGAYAALAAGAAALGAAAESLQASIHITARAPVCRHNLRDLPHIVATCAELGASSVLLAVEEGDLELRPAAPWIGAACDSGVVNSVWVEVEGVPYGFAEGWELHLASVYDRVPGAKSAACHACELDDYCGGAVAGASDRVLSSLFRPPQADAIAAQIAKGFSAVECSNV